MVGDTRFDVERNTAEARAGAERAREAAARARSGGAMANEERTPEMVALDRLVPAIAPRARPEAALPRSGVGSEQLDGEEADYNRCAPREPSPERDPLGGAVKTLDDGPKRPRGAARPSPPRARVVDDGSSTTDNTVQRAMRPPDESSLATRSYEDDDGSFARYPDLDRPPSRDGHADRREPTGHDERGDGLGEPTGHWRATDDAVDMVDDGAVLLDESGVHPDYAGNKYQKGFQAGGVAGIFRRFAEKERSGGYFGRAEILSVDPNFATYFKRTTHAVQRCKNEQRRWSYGRETGRRRRYATTG